MKKNFKKVFQFKITLKHIEPPIWRRIQVPETYTFWDLHVAIQDALGWKDCHLHQFDVLNPEFESIDQIGIPADDTGEIEPIPDWTCKISGYFTQDNETASYLYDFGDSWEHEIKFEKTLPRDKSASYPLCLDGARACPPEDCGGVPGYEDLLEILADRKHEEYEETLEWVGEGFDPEHFDKKGGGFSDPKARLDNLMRADNAVWIDEDDEEDADEEDEWETQDENGASKDLYGPLKKWNRKLLRAIWERAKAGDLEDLEPEHRLLGKIMQEHADEFFNAFEFGDLTHDHEYDPENEVNPFLHISIHAVIESQLAGKDPIEAYQFYNAMRREKCSHHETLHLLGAMLTPLILDCLRQERPFDNEAYCRLLKKYKNKNPQKIPDLLNKEDPVDL